MKRATGSTVRDPQNRSKKCCVCGGHSQKARQKRRRWNRDVPLCQLGECFDCEWESRNRLMAELAECQ
jgi:hypothetical protein